MDDARRADDDASVCPRHPDRAARLRCRRCGRPACPECGRLTTTGVQCVDCAADGQQDSDRTAPVVGDPFPPTGHTPAPTGTPAPAVNPDPAGHREPAGHSEPAGRPDPAVRPDSPVLPDDAANGPERHGDPVAGRGLHRSDTTADVFDTPAGAGDRHPVGRPVVTYALIGLCVVVYLVQMLVPGITDLGSFYPLAGYVEPWRFVTAAFLHSPDTMTHLLFNMMGLYVMGQFLEPFLGRARFAAVYLLSAVGGSVGYLVLVPPLDLSDQLTAAAWVQSMVGASGAVFGLFAAAFLVLRRTGAPVGGMVVLLAINLALPFFYPNIAWQAHLGGAVVGFLATGAILATVRRRSAQWWALGVLALALMVAAWVTYELNVSALDTLIQFA